MRVSGEGRKFLFLQGPHGPFFRRLGDMLKASGAEVRRVVDELGRLHQDVAQRCDQLTWMVAGQAFTRAVERWT